MAADGTRSLGEYVRERGLHFCFEFSGSEVAGRLAQALDVVEGALLGEEDVDDDVNVVQEYPLGLTATFDGGGVETELLFETHLNFVGDGDNLTIIGSGGDEKEIGETGVCRIEFEDTGILAFFVVASGDGSQ